MSTTSAKKILVIDNDKVITTLMSSYFKGKGHQFRMAEDAFAALDILKVYTPDIIYIDLVMPKISGDRLCRIIRKMPQFDHCYIVIISATLAEEPPELNDMGADAAIIKGPFAVMSEYIAETITESEGGRTTDPKIKGIGDCAPRHITQELLSQNKDLQRLLESMSQGVLELDNNRVLYANNSALHLLRYEKETLLGSYLSEILDLHLWEKLGPRISSCQDTSPREEENSPIEIYGRQVILQCIKVNDNPRKRLVLMTDITAQKRMEAIVEATNLTENLGYIFSGIRHEIGNPVNSIKMALTVLQKNLENYDKKTIEEFVASSLEEIVRLEYLLKALKNYSLFETPLVESIAIDQFMENFLPLVRDDLEKKGIAIHTNIPRGGVVALTDSRALHHVMLNLITNAADAVMDKQDGYITISVKKDKEGIAIKVDDNGCGIPEEDRTRIFTPFFTSKPHGTGLGLAIVKKMLMSMNSSIRVDSYRDFGTTVTIKLPEVK